MRMHPEDEAAGIARDFEACAIPKEQWTHAAHLAVAVYYLQSYSEAEAVERMRAGLLRYTETLLGSSAGYHETLTLAWMKVVGGFLVQNPGPRGKELLAALIAHCGDKYYLRRFYSDERLGSAEARAQWVEPDLGPFAP